MRACDDSRQIVREFLLDLFRREFMVIRARNLCPPGEASRRLETK